MSLAKWPFPLRSLNSKVSFIRSKLSMFLLKGNGWDVNYSIPFFERPWLSWMALVQDHDTLIGHKQYWCVVWTFNDSPYLPSLGEVMMLSFILTILSLTTAPHTRAKWILGSSFFTAYLIRGSPSENWGLVEAGWLLFPEIHSDISKFIYWYNPSCRTNQTVSWSLTSHLLRTSFSMSHAATPLTPK